MTPEQINIEIAKVCGWTEVVQARLGHCRISDYFNDLNAMHEAEKALTTNDQVNDYENHLRDLCGGYRQSLHSTSQQRSEAFLRTLNLWKD